MSEQRTGVLARLVLTAAVAAVGCALATGCSVTITGGTEARMSGGGSPSTTGTAGAGKSGPSLTTMCYVRSVEGTPSTGFAVAIDPFEVFDGQEAIEYAAAHGMTVPDNGILYVDPSDETSTFPLAPTAAIEAWSGDLMAPTQFALTPTQLGALARGEDVQGIEAPWQNMWEAVVKDGEITKLTLAVIAD